MQQMSWQEKVLQLQSQLLFFPRYAANRDYSIGNVRNIAHFLHEKSAVSPGTCAAAINEDTRQSIAANRFGIPVLQHGEALHGANWGMATVFPQCIGMAASFDDSLVYEVGKAVASELRAVGVRQVYAPVVNVARDPRWGRMEETYGEDVYLTSRMGVAYTKALQQSGVISTLKHFVDNYGAGGHDSYASETSWRTLRETYLEPFRACVMEGGAGAVMAAYNSVDGVPCSNNAYLLDTILRKEWAFRGIVVSDYGGVNGVYSVHHVVDSLPEAEEESLKAGLDVMLANGYRDLPALFKNGMVTETDIDTAVRRVLHAKIQLGLMEHPFVDSSEANKIVRSPEHKALAQRMAEKTLTLLKNDHQALPLTDSRVKRIGVFGPAADVLSLGDYTGPLGGWKGEDAVTPYEGLVRRMKGKGEVVLCQLGSDPVAMAKTCDVLIFFATIIEGEAHDRSMLGLQATAGPSDNGNSRGVVIDTRKDPVIQFDQEKMIATLAATGVKMIVVLETGAPVDMRNWLNKADAVLEAWYPGEQGGTAIAAALFGDIDPGGRLPVTWPKHVGQVPIYYATKPSGRGSSYSDDDGKPLFAFGYGLSYTSFSYSGLSIPTKAHVGDTVRIGVTIANTGSRSGDAVVQLYLHKQLAEVVLPARELRAFKRISLEPGQSREVELVLPPRDFGYWDRDLQFVIRPGAFDLWISSDADHDLLKGSLILEKSN